VSGRGVGGGGGCGGGGGGGGGGGAGLPKDALAVLAGRNGWPSQPEAWRNLGMNA